MGKVMPAVIYPSLEDLFDIYFTKFLDGYAGFYLKWWREQEKHPDRVLFLFYEDVLVDLSKVLVSISSFLGKELSPDVLERVRYRSSMDYMKPIADSFEPPPCFEAMPKLQFNKGDMINKGVKG